MKVGVVQFNIKFGDKDYNFNRVELLVKSEKLDLLILPEFFATGYNFETRDEILKLSEIFDNGETSSFLKRLSNEISGCVFGGFPEIDGDRLYNSGAFYTKDGKGYLYRKNHLFNREKIFFERGNLGAVVVDYNGIKYGLAICFDWYYPEYFRTLALKSADIICHSTNLVLPFFPKASPIRALENRVYIVTSNRTGEEINGGRILRYIGNSIISSPMGDVLLKADESSEGLFTVDINPLLSRNKMITENNNLFDDRRNDIYFK